MHGETVQLFKNAAYVIAAAAIALQIIPQDIFNAELPSAITSYLINLFDNLPAVYRLIESAYPHYGNKFLLSQIILALVFLIATTWLARAVLKLNSQMELSKGDKENVTGRLLLALSILAVSILPQIFYLSWNLIGSRDSSAPMFLSGLLWIAADWAIVSIIVIWRRGSWLKAA